MRFLAEDEAEAAHIQAKNGLKSFTYSLHNSLSDVKAKLPDNASEIATPRSQDRRNRQMTGQIPTGDPGRVREEGEGDRGGEHAVDEGIS